MAQIAAQPLLLEQGFIGGAWVEADGGGTFPVVDPAKGHELARVPRMGADETRRAIDAARDAYPGWRATLAKERVLAGDHMVVRLDSGSTGPIDADLEDRLIGHLGDAYRDADAIVISDYDYGRRASASTATRFRRTCRTAGSS